MNHPLNNLPIPKDLTSEEIIIWNRAIEAAKDLTGELIEQPTFQGQVTFKVSAQTKDQAERTLGEICRHALMRRDIKEAIITSKMIP